MPSTQCFLLSVLAACAVDEREDPAIAIVNPNADLATADTTAAEVDADYFSVRSDGEAYFVGALNGQRVRCQGKYSNGNASTSCYVTRLDLRSVLRFDDGERAAFLQDVAVGRAVVRGTIQGLAVGPDIQWRFVATEAWRGSGEPVGIVYKAERASEFCDVAPCLAFRETELNAAAFRPLDAVDLVSRAAGQPSEDELATAALTLDEQPILVTGEHQEHYVDGVYRMALAADQVYLPMTHDGLAPRAANGEAVLGKTFVDEARTRRYRFAPEVDAANAIAVTIEELGSETAPRVTTAQFTKQGVVLDPAQANLVRALQWRTDNAGELVLVERNGSAEAPRFREDDALDE